MLKTIYADIMFWINNNRGKFIGGLIGFIFGAFVLIIGLLKTIFLLICTGIGYLMGSKILNKEDLRNFLEKILPPGKIS